jgi:hypothetical protein
MNTAASRFERFDLKIRMAIEYKMRNRTGTRIRSMGNGK